MDVQDHLVYKTSKIVLNDPEYADVKFIIQDNSKSEIIYGHGTVLYVECRKLFDLGRNCNLGDVTIPIQNVSYGAFKEFLIYVYSGHYDYKSKYANELCKLAQRFGKPELEERLMTDQLNNINEENATSLLQMCIKKSFVKQKTQVMEFIADNFSGVLKNDDFFSGDIETVSKILRIDRVCENFTGEMEIFDAVKKYIELNSTTLNVKDLIKLIRFSTMTTCDFLKCLSSLDKSNIFVLCDIIRFSKIVGTLTENIRMAENIIYNPSKNDDDLWNLCLLYQSQEIENVTSSYCKSVSIFFVKQSAVLKFIGLFRPVSETLTVIMTLKNVKGQILFRVRTTVICYNEQKTKVGLHLKPFIELKAGLQHAASLGNIEASTRANILQSTRSCESEDENMGRKKTRPHISGPQYPKTSIYSKGDIREQYCLTDRQLNSIEQPRRERFFGCWSGRNAPQSFLGVCVGRRAPSDENLTDYAPIHRYPRYPHSVTGTDELFHYDEDMENSYFRRRPTSFVTGTDPKRYTWMPADEEAVRMEGPRPICPDINDMGQGPYVVGTYMPKYFSQSTEHLAGLYRCPAHTGVPPPPPPPNIPPDGTPGGPSRQKHVSFARSHTLTSFDDAIGMRPRLAATRSQERLIGGKKPIITTMTTTAQHQPQQLQQFQHPQQQQIVQPLNLQQSVIQHQPQLMSIGGVGQQQQQQQQEVVVVEKIKRGAMKTQATQTEVYLSRKIPPHHLSLSPRTIHRVRMVSQGAQTNGILNGRKLTKSLSEMGGGRGAGVGAESTTPIDENKVFDHEMLHRTQSEEPPRSPFEVNAPPLHHPADVCSRTSSRLSQMETSRSEAFSSENVLTHSRNSSYQSHDSAVSFRSSDMVESRVSQDSLTYENLQYARRGSHVVTFDAQGTKTNDTQFYQKPDYSYANETHSLPRRTCIHHRPEENYHSHSLPRHRMEANEPDVIYRKDHHPESTSRDSSVDSAHAPPPVSIKKQMFIQENHMPLRRASYAVVQQQQPPEPQTPSRRSSVQNQMVNQSSEDFCSTCDSESDSKDRDTEKEILIDFKPRITPLQSPNKGRKKKLQKTLSEGEILIDQRKRDNLLLTSASEEDLKASEDLAANKKNYYYRESPIKDEGVFYKQPFLGVPMDGENSSRYSRENFRKRSISLEDAYPEETEIVRRSSLHPDHQSAFPSTDSLSNNDITRDHSDGIWNESQATVLPAENSPSDSAGTITMDRLSPTARRKNLLLQHQQRSSMDTEGFDFEEMINDQSSIHNLPPPPIPQSTSSNFMVSAVTQTTSQSPALSTHMKSSISNLSSPQTTMSIATVKPTPHIAVTPSLSIEREDQERREMLLLASSRRSSVLSPSRRKEMRKSSMPVVTHDLEAMINFRRKSESLEIGHIKNTGSDYHINRHESGKNNTDISECSTNTDDYITCTDNSRKASGQGTKTPSAPSSSSTTQVPVSAQSSQTVTQDGSSFESASSMYSLARGDAICEDITQVEEIPLPAIPKPKSQNIDPSPTHSVSSSSSESYNLTDFSKQRASPLRTTLPKIKTSKKKKPSESITDDEHNDEDDDEKSEKRYSSSGYYESPQEDEDSKPSRMRRMRGITDEESRRKKSAFKLDFEKAESTKSLTSPITKPSIAFKKISPEDRVALNILDGTSPNKGRRFRPKTKRSPRNRSINSGEETIARRSKTPIAKSPPDLTAPLQQQQQQHQLHQQQQQHDRQPSSHHHGQMPTTSMCSQHCGATNTSSSPSIKVSPSKYQKSSSKSPGTSPRKISNLKNAKDPSPEKRLKALSTESLRSVSPGSDSVFYSEADGISDHQVHCHHCGKEVEIVTAVSGSQNSIGELDSDRPAAIVQPPAGFADSPDAIQQTHHRLYKKLDKRFRSEERHADRRYYRSRPDTRAKSEERGRDEDSTPTGTLRPAGSSPCVLPDEPFSTRDQQADPEQGIYHGYYRIGKWICITDGDVWRRNDINNQHPPFEVRFADRPERRESNAERRGSTDSEKDFRKKYQAITHRLVHRKSCGEMYRRQSTNSFTARALISPTETPETLRRKLEELLRLMFVVWTREGQALKLVTGEKSDTDKTIIVRRESGEFGFRIHGSKPVVVSAIEPDTPAETSGLEIGDIVISVNGISVVDKSHSEVVKIAHAGSDTLELEVARTIGILSPISCDSSTPALYSGYLWRQGGQVSGAMCAKKWVRRWFSLRPDHCLYFYKNETDIQPVGAVILTNHVVENCTEDMGKPFAFCIDGGEAPPLYLAADTDEAANRWIAVMSHASKQSDPWLDVSTRNLRLPPNGVPKPDCFGYLMKLGSKWKSWSKRYCVLKDACLYFYQDANSKNAFGMACLQGYRVQPTSTAGGRKFAFEVTPPEPKLRHYYFSTECEMDKRRWVAALEYSIDRWMKAG